MFDRELSFPSREVLLRIAASILIAVVLWAVVTTIRDPETSRLFSNVPIAAQGLESGLVLIEEPDVTQIRLTGPESSVRDLDPENVEAHVDLTGISAPGTYDLPVNVDEPDDVWSSTTSPDSVEVVVDDAVTDEFPLTPEVEGIVEDSLRTASVDPEFESVEVSGPASAIERIAQVTLPVDVSGRVGAFEGQSEPVAVDVNNEPVDGVTIEPATVSAMINVTSRGKRVAVLVTTVGTPGPGFEVIERTAVPATVLIDGPDDVLDQIVALSTEPINISGTTETVADSATIRDMPDGVVILEPISGSVDILVQIDQRGVNQVLPGQRVTVVDISDGLTAVANPNEVSIEVVAPEEVLSSLSGEEIQVVVSAQGFEPGVHTVTPTLNLPARVQWVATSPMVIELTITSDNESE